MSELYEFKQEDAFRFANSIMAQTKIKGKELHFQYCPYCNGGKKRDKFTFSINLNDGRHTCLRSSCSVKGNMITLSRDMGFELSEDFLRYYNVDNYNSSHFRKFKEAHIQSKDKAIEFLNSRGISENVCRQYELTIKDGTENVLVFPFKDYDGQLRFIKYRNIEFVKGVTDGSKEWCERNCMPILFGMNNCNLENKTLILTEGQLDSLSVTECGFENAVSVPTGMNGFTWVPHCWDWIHNFEKIIVFGDYENGKISLLDEIKKRFKMSIYHVREEDYLDCKDANEILLKHGREQINKCITNAEPVPVNNIISLADVESVNIFEMPKLKTGIKKLDYLLYGGLPFGGITLIAGKPGEGKSTVASQIIINAIENNHKCFVYSGELPNHTFKAWMDFQIAGDKYIRKYQDSKWKDTRYVVDEKYTKKINNWYSDKCFLYDNNIIEGDEKESIVKTVEESICQYGTEVILIDNLMTALDLEEVQSFDKYDKQSLFVKRLTKLALKYNVLILLVAHKRKNNFSTNDNDEISGSGDISNLAMVTLSYGKGKDIHESQRLLKVSKNRLFGKLETNGWLMNYDDASKRIYGDGDDVNVEYGWVKGIDFEDIPEDKEWEIPF
ncbi:MAG: AAA family ATPase [Lachnospiraceae bacterium]|nr:AAA family ATPase [Lachnospiraceae bacterium]